MNSSIPFLGQTSYKSSFQPFKVVASDVLSKKTRDQVFATIFFKLTKYLDKDAIPLRSAYKDNFTSTKTRDFADPRSKVYFD